MQEPILKEYMIYTLQYVIKIWIQAQKATPNLPEQKEKHSLEDFYTMSYWKVFNYQTFQNDWVWLI